MRYFEALRIDWIVEIAQIYGFINREHIERKFGVSTPQASLDLRAACEFCPQLTYDKTRKAYVWRDPLSPEAR